MTRGFARILSLIMLAAGFTAALMSAANAQKALAEDCTMAVQEAWLDAYIAEASTSGECGLGEILLVVRNGKNETVWSETYQTGDLFGFDDILTAADMKLAMTDWLGAYAQQSSSGSLPVWPAGADAPDAGEFPFFVEEGVDRDLYEEVRAEDRGMICYVQGRESLLCLLRHPGTGALEAVGVQTFPG